MSFSKEMLEMFRGRFAAGHGSCPLIGTPDEVADAIESFAKAGFGGMTIAFLDYAKELPYFAQEVLPRLEKKGVRLPK
jgi:alkanesulfonate monooxygenase SsuD/methylene tetrahydromethanopterin reductase-like flavin-dependent oxidoreductase (luciferase family)